MTESRPPCRFCREDLMQYSLYDRQTQKCTVILKDGTTCGFLLSCHVAKGDSVPTAKKPRGEGSCKDRTDEYVANQLLALLPEELPTLADLQAMFDPGQCRGDNVVRLPVAPTLYESLTMEHSSLELLIEPDFVSGARAFSDHVSSALRNRISVESDEITLARFVDGCMQPFSDLIFRQRGISIVRNRNQTEASITARLMRPDLIWLVNGTLLFKGEDKRSHREMAAAKTELLSKMKEWSVNYHGKVDYLLCYAAAGCRVQYCALKRGDQTRVYTLGPECDLSTVEGVLMCIQRAMLVSSIVCMQRQQLPPSFLWLGSVEQREGSFITWFDGYVEKRVQGVDAARASELEGLYKALIGKPCVVQGEIMPRTGKDFVVQLRPVGHALSHPPMTPQRLFTAFMCIFQALRELHAADYGHGDLRWPNVVELPPQKNSFLLIDLEGAVKLGSRCVEPFPSAWREGAVLDNGEYTIASDLRQVGHMALSSDVTKGLGRDLIEGRIRSVDAAIAAVDEALKKLRFEC